MIVRHHRNYNPGTFKSTRIVNIGFLTILVLLFTIMVLSTEKFFRNFRYFNSGNYNLLLCYLSYPFCNAIYIVYDDDSSASPHMCIPCVCTVFSFEQLHRCKKTHTTISHCCFCLFPPGLRSVSVNVLLCVRSFPGNP